MNRPQRLFPLCSIPPHRILLEKKLHPDPPLIPYVFRKKPHPGPPLIPLFKGVFRIVIQIFLHDLVLRQGASIGLHVVTVARIRVAHVRQTERTSAVLVASELGCDSVSEKDGGRPRGAPIAVSAFSALSNSTTPEPRDRPLGSYWISARLTGPMVVKISTRSSLLVDHGNFIN